MELDATMQVTGLDQVLSVMDALPRTLQRKYYMAAMAQAMQPVAAKASELLRNELNPDRTHTLENSLTVYRVRKYQGNYRVVVAVKRGKTNPTKIETEATGRKGGPKTITRAPVRVGLYGSVLEFRDGGKYGYMRKAAQQMASTTIDALAAALESKLNAAVQESKS